MLNRDIDNNDPDRHFSYSKEELLKVVSESKGEEVHSAKSYGIGIDTRDANWKVLLSISKDSYIALVKTSIYTTVVIYLIAILILIVATILISILIIALIVISYFYNDFNVKQMALLILKNMHLMKINSLFLKAFYTLR